MWQVTKESSKAKENSNKSKKLLFALKKIAHIHMFVTSTLSHNRIHIIMRYNKKDQQDYEEKCGKKTIHCEDNAPTSFMVTSCGIQTWPSRS